MPLASGIEREFDVLETESQREARSEIPTDHGPSLRDGVRRSQRPVGDRLDEEVRVDSQRLGQGDRLGDCLDLRGEPVLQDELEPTPVSGRTKPERLAADRGDRLALVELAPLTSELPSSRRLRDQPLGRTFARLRSCRNTAAPEISLRSTRPRW
jgi:hypothetical protein